MNLTRSDNLLREQFPIRRAPTSAASLFVCVGLGWAILGGVLYAQQAPAKVDFEKDVLPLFRENCLDCHGPSKQKAGLRLDRRSSVIKAFARRVVPGNSPNSMVYQRLAGTDYGMQMPPKGALPPDHITLVQAWIDQGASGLTPWPTKRIYRRWTRKPLPWLNRCGPVRFHLS